MSLLKRSSPNAAWEPANLWRLVRGLTHLLDAFTSLSRKGLREVTEVGVCTGRTQAVQIQKCLVQVPLHDRCGFHSVLGFTHSSWEVSACSGRGYGRRTGFAFLRDTWFLSSQFTEKVAHTLQSHVVKVEIEVRSRYRGSTDASWPSGWRWPPLQWNNSDKTGNS